MNARKLAVEAIDKIMEKGAFSNIIVNETLTKFSLSEEDKGLFTNLVYGTLQHLLLIEYYLEPYIERKKPKHLIKYLLYMSVYQIVFLNIPPYAAIDESVKIARLKDAKVASFVNGVLRAFIREPLRDVEDLLSKGDELKYLSVKYSHPEWLVAFFLKDYKYETVEEILIENFQEKHDAIRINTLKITKEEALAKLDDLKIKYQDMDIVQNGVTVFEPVFKTEMFRKGFITIQDISSQMVAEVASPETGSLILDLCSAPGGKVSHLSSIMKNTGQIYACDIYPAKIKLMKNLFTRLEVKNVTCQLIDARLVKDIVKPMMFDYVLADVPCSGLGVISHKIDLKYRITLEAINDILILQREILESTWNLVKVNGFYIYSTCTINKDENELMMKEFVSNHPNFEIVEERKILPQEYHTDGFYICKLRRIHE